MHFLQWYGGDSKCYVFFKCKDTLWNQWEKKTSKECSVQNKKTNWQMKIFPRRWHFLLTFFKVRCEAQIVHESSHVRTPFETNQIGCWYWRSCHEHQKLPKILRKAKNGQTCWFQSRRQYGSTFFKVMGGTQRVVGSSRGMVPNATIQRHWWPKRSSQEY